MRRRVQLKNCPPGLFIYEANGHRTLACKTEYATIITMSGFVQCDAYIVASGEYFCGGVPTYEDRDRLLVTPIKHDEALEALTRALAP